eukprot:750492_1
MASDSYNLLHASVVEATKLAMGKDDVKDDEKDTGILSKIDSGVHKIGKFFSKLGHTHGEDKKPPYLIICEESFRFREMDSYGRDMILNAHALKNEKPFTGQIRKPFITELEYQKVLIANLGKYIAKSDEDAHHEMVIIQIGKFIFEKYLNDLKLHDRKQTLTYWKDANESEHFQKKVATLPSVYIKYDELLSNKSISQFAFSGLGCHYMKKLSEEHKTNYDHHPTHNVIPPNAVYIHDFSFLSIFDVRPGYEKYGAAAYFNKNYEIIGIYNNENDEYVQAVLDNY